MDQLNAYTDKIASLAWGLPLLILLVGGGLYLLIRTNFLPFRYLGHALNLLRGKYDDDKSEGEITHFQALSTALAATVGMGNIAGVAIAIAIGGPGAVFWMWVSAVIGMATKFVTSSLAILYRGKDSDGNIQGGPMYYIVEGLGKNWKPMAVFFSAAAMIGALPIFNTNQLTQAVNDILLKPAGLYNGFQTDLIIGLIITAVTAVVILGGLKRITKTVSKLIPAMVVLYFILVIVVLITHIDMVPKYLELIFTDAFSAQFYKGDAFLGGLVGGLILLGIRRGAFSNEAGIGTAPMAHGAARTNEPIREGLVAMLGPTIDTIVVCTLTALAILTTGVWESSDANGVSLTATAFQESMGSWGKYGLLICISVFSISSLFSYSYYGTKCLSFIVGAKHKNFYNYIYIVSILLGATTSLSTMVNIIDTSFALMAIPNMIAALILAPSVIKEARIYFEALGSSEPADREAK